VPSQLTRAAGPGISRAVLLAAGFQEGFQAVAVPAALGAEDARVVRALISSARTVAMPTSLPGQEGERTYEKGFKTMRNFAAAGFVLSAGLGAMLAFTPATAHAQGAAGQRQIPRSLWTCVMRPSKTP
jgi:hypothetical protein